jgi:glucosamine-6-phosphate deaminase
MSRPISKLAPQWWDYTTLDADLLKDAAKLDARKLKGLGRPGFEIRFYDTLEEFYCAEALEYVEAWSQSSADAPAGICGPIGPTEQLPLVAQMVNALGLDLRKVEAQFWGMDEWVENGVPVPGSHPLSFARADRQLCFNRITKSLRPREENLRFPTGDLAKFTRSFEDFRCVVMQGGQGEIKHWAFNDPVKRAGKFKDAPPSPEEYRKLKTRVVELHPVTVIQNARTSGGGDVTSVPSQAATVGPYETWKAERVSIWHAGVHDNPFGMRLTSLMISEGIADSACPMSLLADHPNVRFNFYRGAIGQVGAEMH